MLLEMSNETVPGTPKHYPVFQLHVNPDEAKIVFRLVRVDSKYIHRVVAEGWHLSMDRNQMKLCDNRWPHLPDYAYVRVVIHPQD